MFRAVTSRAAVLGACVAGSTVLAACATTVDAPAAGDQAPLEAGTIVDDDAPEVTEPLVGSPTELLPDLAAEMSRLGSQIAENGDDDGTLARIERLWAAVRAEVETERPELVGGIDTTVAMSVTAVERRRPADADKAFRLLTDLVDNFTGDG
jgi:hypothetical protein